MANIAFTATSTQTKMVHQDKTVIFDNVITNVGGAYNNSTGVFTAPQDGTYMIQATIRASHGEEIWANLSVNKSRVVSVNARGTDGRHGMGSQSMVVTLGKGDIVTIECKNENGNFYGHYYETFSGYFLFK